MNLNLRAPDSAVLPRPQTTVSRSNGSPGGQERTPGQKVWGILKRFVLPCWGFKHFFPQLKIQHFSFFWQSLSLVHRSLSLCSQCSLNRGHLPKEEAVFKSRGLQCGGSREAYVQVCSP